MLEYPDPDADTAEYYLPVSKLEVSTPVAFSSRVRVDIGAATHTGKVRPNNEDAFLVFRTGRYFQKVVASMAEDLLPERHEEMAHAMAVADGMGGLASGEIASSTVMNTVVNLMLSSVKWALKLDHAELREQELQEGMDRALGYLKKAHETIVRKAKAIDKGKRMGTTLTATYTFGDDLFIFHIGDSRAYLYRKGSLKRLTRDHTLAQELADIGGISEKEVSQHYLKHVLTRALGVKEGKLEIEIQHLRLEDGDTVLLCTDGLTDTVRDPEMAKVLSGTSTAQEKCRRLIDKALQRAARDNITVVIAAYEIPTR